MSRQPRLNLQAALDDRAQRLAGGKWTQVDWRAGPGRAGSRIDRTDRRRQRRCANSSLLKGRRFVSLAFLGPADAMRAPEAERFFKSLTSRRDDQAAHPGPGAGRHHRHASRRLGRHADGAGRRRSRGRRARCSPTLAEIEAETVSRVGSHSLSFDQIHALAAKIAALDGRRRVVTQGTDTLEETELPARPAARSRHPGDRDGGDAQSRAHLARRAGQPAGRRARGLRSVGARARQGAGRHGRDAGRGLCRFRRAEDPSDAAQRLRLDRRPGRSPRWSRIASCRWRCRCATPIVAARSAARRRIGRQGSRRSRCSGWGSTNPAT